MSLGNDREDLPANPYQPPSSTVTSLDDIALSTINWKIGVAIFAGCITSLLLLVTTLVLVVLGAATGTGVDAWPAFGCIGVASLTYGVFRKKRLCALILLAIGVVEELLLIHDSVIATPLTILLPPLIYCSWLGVSGTFAYHRFMAVNIN
jgi:hypothetical protein